MAKSNNAASNSSSNTSANFARITATIGDTLRRAQEVADAAAANDMAFFERKEIAQELRNIEISVSYVRLAIKFLKLDEKLNG